MRSVVVGFRQITSADNRKSIYWYRTGAERARRFPSNVSLRSDVLIPAFEPRCNFVRHHHARAEPQYEKEAIVVYPTPICENGSQKSYLDHRLVRDMHSDYVYGMHVPILAVSLEVHFTHVYSRYSISPRTLEGGDLHWIYKPLYGPYVQIDKSYGAEAFERGDGFLNAQCEFLERFYETKYR